MLDPIYVPCLNEHLQAHINLKEHPLPERTSPSTHQPEGASLLWVDEGRLTPTCCLIDLHWGSYCIGILVYWYTSLVQSGLDVRIVAGEPLHEAGQRKNLF